jgi:hypothetical protein
LRATLETLLLNRRAAAQNGCEIRCETFKTGSILGVMRIMLRPFADAHGKPGRSPAGITKPLAASAAKGFEASEVSER